MEESYTRIKNKLRLATPNYIEIKKMIDSVIRKKNITFSYPIKEGYILHSYPEFYLFKEQENDPELFIRATRFYTDQKGQNIFFFSSSCSQKAVRVCQKAMEKYLNDHSLSIKMHRNYPLLQYLIDKPDDDFYIADFVSRTVASVLLFNFFLGIAYGIEKLAFSPHICNAFSGYKI